MYCLSCGKRVLFNNSKKLIFCRKCKKRHDDKKIEKNSKKSLTENKKTVYSSLEKINKDKVQREKLIKTLSGLEEELQSKKADVQSAYRYYQQRIEDNNKSYRRNNLSSNRTTLEDVWNAEKVYENKKENIKNEEIRLLRQIERTENKLNDLNKNISLKENQYISSKIKPNIIDTEFNEDLENILNLESAKLFIKAKKAGYVPSSEFITLVEKHEGRWALKRFLESEPMVDLKGEDEYFVCLTDGTYTFNDKTNEFTFNKEIEYTDLAFHFNSKSVNDIRVGSKQPNAKISAAYESGEAYERVQLYQSFESQIDLHKKNLWEKVVNKNENGFFETEAEKEERIYQENQKKEKLIKQKNFIKNYLPIYKKAYSKINDFEKFFYEDDKLQTIKSFWLDVEIVYQLNKDESIYRIKPCIYGCTSKEEEYKFLFKSKSIKFDSNKFRLYRCNELDSRWGFHLTSQIEKYDEDYYY